MGRSSRVDQDGRPALVAHSYGKGKTLLSAYPLETYLAVLPSAFEHPENTHRIYRGLVEWAGVTPLFSTDAPGVEVAGLIGEGRGYAVLANHQPEKCLRHGNNPQSDNQPSRELHQMENTPSP